MPDPARSILLLAGRLGIHDEGWSIRPFLDRLARLGLEAQVLCISAAGEAASDLRVVDCPGLGRRWGASLSVRSLRFGERLEAPALCHALTSRLGDVALALAEHWRIPYLQTIDEFLPSGGRLRLSRRWCRGLVATSRELADDLTSQLAIPPGWITVVNPGIDAPDDPSPREAPSGKRLPVIGTAGPLVPASGFATFLNAARKVLDAGVDAEFVIAGQGADEVDLRRRADRLKIADRVTFAGIPVVGLRFWSVLDVFCQPSLVPSVAKTLATALASGVPSIASDIGGLRALIAHGRSGLRVPPGDSSALAAAVLELLSDRERARALGAEGRAVIRRDYDPDVEAATLAEVYRRALDAEAFTPRWSPQARLLAAAPGPGREASGG